MTVAAMGDDGPLSFGVRFPTGLACAPVARPAACRRPAARHQETVTPCIMPMSSWTSMWQCMT